MLCALCAHASLGIPRLRGEYSATPRSRGSTWAMFQRDESCRVTQMHMSTPRRMAGFRRGARSYGGGRIRSILSVASSPPRPAHPKRRPQRRHHGIMAEYLIFHKCVSIGSQSEDRCRSTIRKQPDGQRSYLRWTLCCLTCPVPRPYSPLSPVLDLTLSLSAPDFVASDRAQSSGR